MDVQNKLQQKIKKLHTDFLAGIAHVNIQPDLVLTKSNGKEWLYVYKAFVAKKELPKHFQEFVVTSNKRLTTQTIHVDDSTLERYHKKDGHLSFAEVKGNLKHLGWMDANLQQERSDIQKNADARAKEKREMREALRAQGLLDKYDNPILAYESKPETETSAKAD